MRLVKCFVAVCVLSVSVPVLAEEWIEYADRAERFMVNLPGKPTIRETTYAPQRGPMLPGRVYTVQDGPRRYTVTVVNYAGANVNDVPHAVAWEAWNYRKRGGDGNASKPGRLRQEGRRRRDGERLPLEQRQRRQPPVQ